MKVTLHPAAEQDIRDAAAFYERMGARYLRNAPSDAIPGRTLPFYEYDLPSETLS